ncbi:MAG TPA: type II toxin-antitoxin system HicA family toxin [Polyangiaceae bacterium]
MRLPRDISGDDLVRALAVFGYLETRQIGSHVRLTTGLGGEHHVTVPRHPALRVGTLGGIVVEVATHHKLSRDEVARRLFER